MKKLTVLICLVIIMFGLFFHQSTVYVKNRIASDKKTIDKLTEINRKALELVVQQQEIINEYRRLIKDMGKEGNDTTR